MTPPQVVIGALIVGLVLAIWMAYDEYVARRAARREIEQQARVMRRRLRAVGRQTRAAILEEALRRLGGGR